jgi:hypothetical protein
MSLEKVESEKTSQKEKEKSKKKEILQVVAKLPVQEVRRIEYEDYIANLITIEEYLTQMANAGIK